MSTSVRANFVTKDTVVKSLESLWAKPQRIIKRSGFFIWDILLRTPEVFVKAASRDLITKDQILSTVYDG